MKGSTQFRRTDRAIIDATIRLLRERSFEELTVQNILDETPVSRATFYAHFHDKYEVAERMQDIYMQAMQDIPATLSQIHRKNHPQVIQRQTQHFRDLVQTLLKIRTERVNLHAVTAKMYKAYYLTQATGEYAAAQAEVYAQTMTAVHFTYLDADSKALDDEDYFDKVMVAVFLKILKLDGNEELRQQIFAQLPSHNSKPASKQHSPL